VAEVNLPANGTAPLSESAAQVIDVHKHYRLGDHIVKALRGVTLDFPKGDFVAIMGASGSGKSTLLNTLGCLDRPTSGHYLLGGRDVSGMDDTQLSHVRNEMLGFVFQSYNLIAQYTVMENIELPLQYRADHRPISAKDRAWCLELAQKVGLGDRLDHRPFQLSGGQQQRVAVARALVNDPEIILADEPTGNLDSKTSVEIMAMLTALNREGRTIIMVTHEQDIADHARRQIVMRDGVVFKESYRNTEEPVAPGVAVR
jgi:putative ABC transport system ATP-binding protein